MIWDQMIREILSDVSKLVSATPQIKYIVGIVQYNGKMFARPVYQPSPFSIIEDATPGTAQGVMIMTDPPIGWESVNLQITPKKNGVPTIENTPVVYYLMKDDGSGLGIPSRFNPDRKIGWSHNEEIIDYVGAALAHAGLLKFEVKA